MASYKARLRDDLDRWVAQGLVPAASREPILAGVVEPRRLDAATALGVIGALLAGVAVIAFVADNWDGIPRLARFAMVLTAFLAVAAGAGWAAKRERPILSNTLLTVAALIYAGAIGLVGQIFNLPGRPEAALRLAGQAAMLLALGGRSSGAAVAGLALTGFGDFVGRTEGEDWSHYPWLAVLAPGGVALAWVWRSTPLAHAAGLATIAAAGLLISLTSGDYAEAWFLAAAVGFALAAAGARRLPDDTPLGRVLLGWFVLGALGYFALAGLADDDPSDLPHRLGWLIISACVIALGRHDRHPTVTGLGVVSLIAAISAILFDLGLGLMTAAAVFAVCALGALVAGWLLRRRAKA